jgi:glutaconate CoA-transferase, subunit A
LKLEEHACATLTAGLRAAAFGVPFMPCGGVHGSELVRVNDWKCIDDPYGSGQQTYVIPAISPDFAVIHASSVDRLGNVRVAGTYHWDRIMSRASKSVLVVAEEVSDENFADQPELTVVPYFMVQNYAIVKNGAWPGSCWPSYAIDYPAVEAYLEDGADALARHIDAAPEARQHG